MDVGKLWPSSSLSHAEKFAFLLRGLLLPPTAVAVVVVVIAATAAATAVVVAVLTGCSSCALLCCNLCCKLSAQSGQNHVSNGTDKSGGWRQYMWYSLWLVLVR